MSRQSYGREVEMKDAHPKHPLDGERHRTSSAAAIQFQRLKQMQQNDVAAQKSRKTSRISKGLNPDVPKPNKAYLCRCHFI